MKKLLAYIAAYAPAFPTRVAGADRVQIEELERFAGRRLPASYRDFLETMGRDDGGLNFGVEASSGIDRILAHYREAAADGEAPAPPGGIAIAVGGVAIEEVSLICEPGEEEPRVVFSSGELIVAPYADAFDRLLFRLAFTKYRIPALPVQGRYTGLNRERLIGPAKALALRLGFRAQWFTDSLAFCGERDDGAAIAVTEYQGLGLAVRLAARDRASVEEAGETFVREFQDHGFRFEGWLP